MVNLAKKLMRLIQLDNGIPEEYPQMYVNQISIACKLFFGANPQFNNEEDLESIAYGDESEYEKFEGHTGWTELHNSLNDYFNEM